MGIEGEIIVLSKFPNYQPVCMLSEGVKFVSEGISENHNLSVVNIQVVNPVFLNEIFHYNTFNTALFDKKYFIIDKIVENKIQTFIRANNLDSQKNLIFKIIALINLELTFWQNKAKKNKDEVPDQKAFQQNFDNIETDELQLKNALSRHKLATTPPLSNERQMKQVTGIKKISFEFDNDKKPLTNFFVNSKIADCLIEHYYFMTDQLSINFRTYPTQLKQLFSKNLSDFLNIPGTEWYTKSQSGRVKKIINILSCAQIIEGTSSDSDLVLKWTQRAV